MEVVMKNVGLKISYWKFVSIFLMLYLIVGVFYTIVQVNRGGVDLFLNKKFCLYYFSIGGAAFLNYFVPISGHQQKPVVFFGFLSGFLTMFISLVMYSLLPG